MSNKFRNVIFSESKHPTPTTSHRGWAGLPSKIYVSGKLVTQTSGGGFSAINVTSHWTPWNSTPFRNAADRPKATLRFDVFYYDIMNWAVLWLAKKLFYTVWVKIQLLDRIVYTSRFWVIFGNCQNCKQIIGTPSGSIFHAAKSSQIPYMATIEKPPNLIIQLKIL